MDKKTFQLRLTWLGLTVKELLPIINERRGGRKVTSSCVSTCFSDDCRDEWARRLNADLDATTRRLIGERRAALKRQVMVDLHIDEACADEIDIILPVDDGIPVVMDRRIIGKWFPGKK